MKIKPIKTEKDHEAALKAVESLWNAKPNTPRSKKLDLLVALIESYENKKHKILPPYVVLQEFEKTQKAVSKRIKKKGLKPKDVEKAIEDLRRKKRQS